MKILHTSDWHLGKYLGKYSRLPEQEIVLNEICQIADEKDVDAVIIAGDLFDTYNPSTEAENLFYKTLKKLSNEGTRLVIAAAGNHDSAERIAAPDPIARECGIIFSGLPNTSFVPFSLNTGLEVLNSAKGFIELKLPKSEYPLRLLITPYANERTLRTYISPDNYEEELQKIISDNWNFLAKKYCKPNGVNILIAHLYIMNNSGIKIEEPDGEKSILHVGGVNAMFSDIIPSEIQYTALGHLHRQHFIENNKRSVAYSGSILPYSFSEANQNKSVIIINAEPSQPVITENIILKSANKLFREKFNNVSDTIEWLKLHKDNFVEITLSLDSFITPEIRRQLNETHSKIVDIIPDIKLSESEESIELIDINQNIEKLFELYFEKTNNSKPSEEIIDLFKEIHSS
jgi:DNA repair protein SbcD/Mre11